LDGRKRSGGAIYAVYNFENLKSDFGVSYSNLNKNFDAQSGFVRRTGFNRIYSYVGRSFRPKEKTWWVKVRPFIVGSALWNTRNKLDESFFDPGFDIEFAKGISLYTYFSARRDDFLGRGYTTRAFLANFGVYSFKRFSFGNSFEIGTGVNFDPARTETGSLLSNSLSFTFRPTNQLSTEQLWIKSNLKSRVNDDKLFNQNIFRNKTTYQFNRFNSVRSIVDYDTAERRLGLSFLYAFTPSPNKAVYIGYNDLLYNGLEPLDGTRQRGLIRQGRGLFAKFSYNLRF
jgi:hypothetical protein